MKQHHGRCLTGLVFCGLLLSGVANLSAAEPKSAEPQINVVELIKAGGKIGYIIMALSVAMIALVVEHAMSIRRAAIMPAGLAEEVYRLIAAGQFKQAEQECKQQPSFLAYVLGAALLEVPLGYSAVEKTMEDVSSQQASRLFRKIEYLSVISTIAPMLGLLGTVWGMILAFMEFEAKANPQVSELAPGIYRALVTTLQGLCVAIPAIAAYAFFRNRIDELVAQASLTAEHVFSSYRRAVLAKQQAAREQPRKSPEA